MPKYFFTTHYPHRWTSGPNIYVLDIENNCAPIASLERARELAQEASTAKRMDDSRCVTTYGLYYGSDETPE